MEVISETKTNCNRRRKYVPVSFLFLSVCLNAIRVCLSVCLSLCLSVCLSVSLCQSVSVCVCLCLSVYHRPVLTVRVAHSPPYRMSSKSGGGKSSNKRPNPDAITKDGCVDAKSTGCD